MDPERYRAGVAELLSNQQSNFHQRLDDPAHYSNRQVSRSEVNTLFFHFRPKAQVVSDLWNIGISYCRIFQNSTLSFSGTSFFAFRTVQYNGSLFIHEAVSSKRHQLSIPGFTRNPLVLEIAKYDLPVLLQQVLAVSTTVNWRSWCTDGC